ncbi:MAG TPA: HD-GYP domain-containing protein [Patescibacteria group bacterium]|nr:HD-GYP domain-containing protein [Patescibacteria group bacterium]
MRRCALQDIRAGMKLARPIYSPDGTILLSAGMELRSSYIERLNVLDISHVYIEDELTQDIDIPDVVDESVRREVVTAARSIIEHSRVGKGIDAERAKKTANMLVDELSSNRGTLVNFTDMRARGEYLFSHVANVCILSIMTGMNLGYDQLRLRDLGVGALLHDVGQIFIPKEIFDKNEKLTQEEVDAIRRHPELGFELIRKSPEISILSAHCAFQHHERVDGSGYPRGLQGSDVHQYAQIVGIADVFDALSSNSAYRRALHPREALAILQKASDKFFDEAILQAFCDNIAVYPIGSLVRLNTKQIAVVVDISREAKSRPVVRIVLDEWNQKMANFLEIDLSKHPQVYVESIVNQ